jgi:WD40 repeat protein
MHTWMFSSAAFLTAALLGGCNDAGLAPDRLITTNVDQARMNPPDLSLGSAASGDSRYSPWSPPVPLDAVNSPSIDQQPALSKDGLSLYFASNRLGGPGGLDIWVAQRTCVDGCSWMPPEPLGPNVNGTFPDISPSLSRDGHQLFFASQRPHDHCDPPSLPPCTNRDLWVSYRENVHDDFGWEAAVNLGDYINTPGEEIAPSYFENDEGLPQLFFNRGAVGGDIYMSELENGVWAGASAVQKLNTSGTDQRPSISHDGLEIYFYSDRDGANRLWVARRGSVSSDWSTPVRVDFPSSEQEAIMPFIHSHGKTETLVFVRPFSLAARDLWITTRTRQGGRD